MLKPTPNLIAQPTYAGNVSLLEDGSIEQFEKEDDFKSLISKTETVKLSVTAIAAAAIIASQSGTQKTIFDAINEENSIELNSPNQQESDPNVDETGSSEQSSS